MTTETTTGQPPGRTGSAPPATGEDAWQRLHALQRLAATHPDRAARDLAELFASGQPSTGIDGRTQGMLVTPLVHPLADRVVRGLTRWRMPWLGKHFEADAGTGVNLLARWTRWQLRLIWPGYRQVGTAGEALTAFSFETRTEQSALDDDLRVLAIDYGAVPDNPDLLIRRIRDELVQLVADVHLGRALYRRDGNHTLVGYFALRTT